MKRIDFFSTNIKKIVEEEFITILPSRVEKIFFERFLNERFLVMETEKFSITFLCNTNNPLFFKGKIEGQRVNVNFCDSLKHYFKGIKLKNIIQYGLERIVSFEFSNKRKILVIFIPSKFNILILDEDFTILNIYSFKKNKDGQLIYKIGDIFNLPELKDDEFVYLDLVTKNFLKEKNLSLNEFIGMEHSLYETSSRYLITPFELKDAVLLKKDASISNLIKEYLKVENEKNDEEVKRKIQEKLEREISILKKEIEKIDEKRVLSEIEQLKRIIQVLEEEKENIGEKKIITIDDNRKKEIEIVIDKNLYNTINKFYSRIKDLKKEYESMKVLKEKLQKKINELEIKKKEGVRIFLPEFDHKDKKKIGKRFLSPKGFLVVCGRNAMENEKITFELATKNDLFFHAREAKGAHVILKKDGREPSMDDIYYAASIAAYNSKGKHSKMVPVSYTERRYVIKRKKSPPGEVIETKEKVIFVEPKER